MKRRTTQEQLEKDIEFCLDICNMNDEQIGEMLRVCEQLGGISCEYFAEEFVFLDEPEALEKFHDSSYLRMKEVNNIFWSTFQ